MIGGKPAPKAAGKALFTVPIISGPVSVPASGTGAQSVAVGNAAVASGSFSSALGASSNVSGNSGVAVGFTSSASGSSATTVGSASSAGGANAVSIGTSCSASQANSIAMGYFATPDFAGENTFSSMIVAAGGDTKVSIIDMVMQTTNATATEMSSGGQAFSGTPSTRITLTAYSSYIFDIDIVCRQMTSVTGQTAAWNLKFACYRDATAASFVLGTVTKTVLMQTGALTAADVSVTADTTNGRPAVMLTGIASTNLRWVGFAKMTCVKSV